MLKEGNRVLGETMIISVDGSLYLQGRSKGLLDGPIRKTELEPVVDTGTVPRGDDADAAAEAVDPAADVGGAVLAAAVALASKRFAPIDCSVLDEFPIGARPVL